MPSLKFKAMDSEKIKVVSKELVDELQSLLQCPRDYFNIEIAQSLYVRDGEYVSGYPMVEVAWFERPQEIQDQAAKIITKFVNKAGYDSVDVIFTLLQENNYYENGEHF